VIPCRAANACNATMRDYGTKITPENLPERPYQVGSNALGI
jgi:hypothetical protein